MLTIRSTLDLTGPERLAVKKRIKIVTKMKKAKQLEMFMAQQQKEEEKMYEMAKTKKQKI